MIHCTTHMQRSFDNSWAITPLYGLPAGVIVDLSFSIPKNYSNDIELITAKVSSQNISLAFQLGRSNHIVDVTTNVVGTPISMNCPEGVIANVLIGYIPQQSGDLLDAGKSVKINPAVIQTYNSSSDIAKQHLFVSVDDDIIFDDYLTTDIVLIGGNGILIQKKDNEFTASKLAEIGVGVNTVLVPETTKKVYRINNTPPNSSGEVSLTISIPRLSLTPTLSAQDPSYGILDTTADGILKLLEPEDVIDKHVSPKVIRDYPYLPLDDAYVDSSGNLGSVRRVMETLGADNTAIYRVTSATVNGSTGVPTVSKGSGSVDQLNGIYDS